MTTEKPKPFTREEIIRWPAIGPMNLDMQRMLVTVETCETFQLKTTILRQELEEMKTALVAAEAKYVPAVAENVVLRAQVEALTECPSGGTHRCGKCDSEVKS